MMPPRWTAYPALSLDVVWALVTVFTLGLSSVHFSRYSSLPSMAIWVLFGPGLSVLTVYFIVTRPRTYLQYRTSFLVFLKLGRIYALVLNFVAHEEEISPLPEDRMSMIFASFQRAVMLLCAALGFQLPLSVHLPVQALQLAVSLSSSCQRCSMDCAYLRGRGLYQGIAAHLNTAFSKAFPIIAGGGPAKSALDPCMLLQAWSQVVFGLLLPSIFVDLSEKRLKVWDVPRDGGHVQRITLAGWPTATVLGHLSLLAVASPVCWKGIELVFRVLQGYGFLGSCGSCSLEPG